MFTDTVTIFRKAYNPATGFDEYTKTVLAGVSWYSQLKTVQGNNGIAFAKLFKMRIPVSVGKKFAFPLDFTDPETQYTIQPGDLVFKGTVTEDLQAGSAIGALQSKCPEHFTVLALHDNRGKMLPHVYVEGK